MKHVYENMPHYTHTLHKNTCINLKRIFFLEGGGEGLNGYSCRKSKYTIYYVKSLGVVQNLKILKTSFVMLHIIFVSGVARVGI